MSVVMYARDVSGIMGGVVCVLNVTYGVACRVLYVDRCVLSDGCRVVWCVVWGVSRGVCGVMWEMRYMSYSGVHSVCVSVHVVIFVAWYALCIGDRACVMWHVMCDVHRVMSSMCCGICVVCVVLRAVWCVLCVLRVL